MEYKTYNSTLQENEKPIYALSKRVGSNTETVQQLVLSQNEMMNQLNRMSVKIDKIHDKVFEKPEYFSVGEIALRQGVDPKTVRRHIKKGNIPYERNEGEKSYRIPSAEYYQSLSHDGASSWFQNHTRE
jgi:excisionase family DNA binding protein